MVCDTETFTFKSGRRLYKHGRNGEPSEYDLAVKTFDIIEGFQGVAFGTMDGLITILGVVIGIASATENT